MASREGQGTQGQNALAQATVSGSQGYYSFSGSERLQPQTQSAGIIIWSLGAPFLVTQFFVRKKCPLFLVPYMKVSAYFHLLAFFACWLGAVRATVNRLGRREKNRRVLSLGRNFSPARPDRAGRQNPPKMQGFCAANLEQHHVSNLVYTRQWTEKTN